jgi:hypothetical protein
MLAAPLWERLHWVGAAGAGGNAAVGVAFPARRFRRPGTAAFLWRRSSSATPSISEFYLDMPGHLRRPDEHTHRDTGAKPGLVAESESLDHRVPRAEVAASRPTSSQTSCWDHSGSARPSNQQCGGPVSGLKKGVKGERSFVGTGRPGVGTAGPAVRNAIFDRRLIQSAK